MSNDPSSAIVAVLAVLVLALILRWVFRPSHPRTGVRPVDAADSTDLGLLTVVVANVSHDEAMHRRATLGEAGIRSSMSRRRDGALDVLVFHADADLARLLLNV